MAEMLVRLVDKINANDARKNARLTKRGDVIVIQEDGWPWSPLESRGDPWMVVKVPGVDPSDLSAFTSEELDDGTPKLLQRRAFSFNLTAYLSMPEQARAHFPIAQALSMKVVKPSIPDPDVL